MINFSSKFKQNNSVERTVGGAQFKISFGNNIGHLRKNSNFFRIKYV